MVVTVKGFQHKQGTVEGRPYDFFEFHCMAPNIDVTGEAVSIVKLKPDVLAEVLGEVGGLPQNLIGQKLFIDFDSKNRPMSCDLMQQK